MDVLIISDSKFFIEAVKFILMDSGDYVVESKPYSSFGSNESSILNKKYSIVFIDVDCCPEEEKENIKEELKNIVMSADRVYVFSFDVKPLHETVKEFIETLHADGLIKRPISPKRVLEALGL